MADAQTTAVEQVPSITSKELETISLADLLKKVVPDVPPVRTTPAAPPASRLTKEQKAALNRLPKVYGQVAPGKRRLLDHNEVIDLVDERDTLTAVRDMAGKRIEDIRTIVFNHFDVRAEAEGRVADDTYQTKDGHYILEDEEVVADRGKRFVRQTSNGAPSLSVEMLEALAEDPEVEGFTREDYLASTTQTRVFDQEKFLILLRKRPELLGLVAKATTPGRRTASLYLRDVK